MKREILFKAKRKFYGNWIEGIPTFDKKYLFNSDNWNSPDNYEIDPETLCQFTGKSESKNHPMFDDRLKLWEDDIFVIAKHNTKYRVVFENFEWIGISNEGDDWGKYKYRLSAIKEAIRIIGNFHDTPELFKAAV